MWRLLGSLCGARGPRAAALSDECSLQATWRSRPHSRSATAAPPANANGNRRRPLVADGARRRLGPVRLTQDGDIVIQLVHRRSRHAALDSVACRQQRLLGKAGANGGQNFDMDAHYRSRRGR